MSLLHVARQMKAAPQAEEPEKWLLWGAAGQMVDHLSKEIKELGGVLRTSTPVTNIEQADEGVTVETDSTESGVGDSR